MGAPKKGIAAVALLAMEVVRAVAVASQIVVGSLSALLLLAQPHPQQLAAGMDARAVIADVGRNKQCN